MYIFTSVRILSILVVFMLSPGGITSARAASQKDVPSQNDAAPQASSKENSPATSAPYRLQPGDVIEIRLFYNPELNEQVQIRPDGRVSLQLIGEVDLASKTIAEAVSFLQEKYIKEVRTPELTVQVKTYGSQKVYVVGEVLHPGMFNLPGPMTVFDAISEAGGVKLTGNHNLAVLLRKGANGSPEGK